METNKTPKMESNELPKEDKQLISKIDELLGQLKTISQSVFELREHASLVLPDVAPVEQVEGVKFWEYIRCIDNVCSGLTIDKVYKVIRLDNDGCYVITDDRGNEFGYYPQRFDVATEAEYLSQQEQPKEEVKETQNKQ